MTVVLVVQHVEPEGPALLGEALRERGCEIDVVHVYRGDPVPTDLGSHAGLVVLGGPMSAGSDDGFPSRAAELTLIRDALARGRPILGLCLGAQLLAAAAGAAIRPGSGPEVGWGFVELQPAAVDDPLFGALEGDVPVLHWHHDTFDLPPNAAHIAASSRYENQAYRVGDVAWGLQFHVEVDPAAVAGWVRAFPDDAATSPGGAPAILADSRDASARTSAVRAHVLGGFAQIVHQRG